MMRIAYMGPGTFSEESARHVFGDQFDYVPYRFISEVFMSTVEGTTDLSVIPIENTIDGSVSLHMDWLVHEVDLPIRAEWVYPIEMNLIGWAPEGHPADHAIGLTGDHSKARPDIDLSHIRKIITYPVAYAQCRKFVQEHLPHAEFSEAASTADGVRIVSELQDPSVVAIGPGASAQLYGVPVLASKIQDLSNNYTRFVLVGRQQPELKDSQLRKTTILVTLPEDYPGALHQVLSAFAWRRINLSKIESRPTKKRLGNYYFYIDIEADLESILLKSAIEEIQSIGSQVRIMGTYPSYIVGESI